MFVLLTYLPFPTSLKETISVLVFLPVIAQSQLNKGQILLLLKAKVI